MQNSRADLKEIVVLSGKGGTGKTTITASLAAIFKDKIMVDCDVDAANLFMVMRPSAIKTNEFYSGITPTIDLEACTGCLICTDVCEFDAIDPETLAIDEINCEGCGVCHWFCPQNAITLKQRHCGRWFVGETRYGPMVYAELFPGEENSGKLVYTIKNAARDMAEEMDLHTILIDGPPGIACPVISTISGADHALIVTEPTLSGLSDLQRILRLCRHFKLPTSCIINRCDIFPNIAHEIKKMLDREEVPLLGELPFSEEVAMANQKLVPFVEAYPHAPFTRALEEMAGRLSIPQAWLPGGFKHTQP